MLCVLRLGEQLYDLCGPRKEDTVRFNTNLVQGTDGPALTWGCLTGGDGYLIEGDDHHVYINTCLHLCRYSRVPGIRICCMCKLLRDEHKHNDASWSNPPCDICKIRRRQ